MHVFPVEHLKLTLAHVVLDVSDIIRAGNQISALNIVVHHALELRQKAFWVDYVKVDLFERSDDDFLWVQVVENVSFDGQRMILLPMVQMMVFLIQDFLMVDWVSFEEQDVAWMSANEDLVTEQDRVSDPHLRKVLNELILLLDIFHGIGALSHNGVFELIVKITQQVWILWDDSFWEPWVQF